MVGNVYWITGLSGAGKTTIAKELTKQLKLINKPIIFLDGDILREVFCDSLGHSMEERKILSYRYSRLCRMLSLQNFDVVCATVSMFNDVRDWNKNNLENYIEVFLDVPIEVLIKRDQKNLYSGALSGQVQDVLGVNLDYEAPQASNLRIINDGTKTPIDIVDLILNYKSKR